MADWGPFVQGLAQTLPQVGFATYGARQRDEALARQEKQLAEQIKKNEINEAQQNFLKGIELVDKLSPEVAPYVINNLVKPSITTLDKHGITSYGDQGINDFITKMNENPSAAKAIAKDLKAITQMKGPDGKPLSGKETIKQMNMVISAHSARLSKEQKESLQGMVSEAAMGSYETAPAEDKPYIGAHMSKTQQDAFGVGKGPKSAPQRSFTGPGGKTMRVNQVFDESTGTYKDVGDPWEYKDPAAVVTVTQNAKEKAGGGLSDEAIKLEGIKYFQTGKMPSMGMGSANLRAKIINAAAEHAKSLGVNPQDVPSMQAEYQSLAGALNKMQRDYAGFASFEQGMVKNMDYALSISKKFGNTPLPAANKIINALKTQTGDPQIVEYANAIYAAAMEYEKIRTAGTAITSAELSVAAQKKAEELINTSQTHKQLMGAAKAMKTDTRNITSSRKGQIDQLNASLRQTGMKGGSSGKNLKDMSDEELLRELNK